MNNDSNNSNGGGVILGMGFTSILTIVFIVLKLCGVIGWSWFWVLSPLIFSFVLVIGIFLLLLVILFIVSR